LFIVGTNQEGPEKVWRATVSFPADLAGPALGIFTLAGLKVPRFACFLDLSDDLLMFSSQEFTFQLDSDAEAVTPAYYLHFDVQVAKSSFALAKQFLGNSIPPPLACARST